MVSTDSSALRVSSFGTIITYITMYQCVFFSVFARFSPAPVGLFLRTRLRGTQGAHLYTTAQVWVPGGLRGACSRHSKSPNPASNHGVVRGARVEQDNGNTTCQLFCSTAIKALHLVAATVQEKQSHVKFVWTNTMRAWPLHMRVCCVL